MRALAPVRWIAALAERERKFLLGELSQAKGLLPVLMKPRNGYKWTREDVAELRAQFRRLSRLSSYIAALVVPGGFAVLPAFIWWLDRRRIRRAAAISRQRSGRS